MSRRHFHAVGVVAIGILCAGGLGRGESLNLGILQAGNRIADDQPVDPVPPPPAPSFSIIQQPGNQTVLAGQTATFSVLTTTAPGLTYQWQRNGLNISGATSASLNRPSCIYPNDGGSNFRVVIKEANGATVISQIANLTVAAVGDVPPAPTAAPTLEQYSTSSVRMHMTFPPINTSVADALYGEFCADSACNDVRAHLTAFSLTNGQTSLSSNVLPFKPDDVAHDYYGRFQFIKISNQYTRSLWSPTGSVPIELTAPPIVILQGPASQGVSAGQTATFTVNAQGSGLHYQWQKNGVNVSGATSATYVTGVCRFPDDTAIYRVVVTDNTGKSVTTEGAVLTVNPSGPVPTIPGTPTLTQVSTTSVHASWTASTVGSGSIAYIAHLSTTPSYNGSYGHIWNGMTNPNVTFTNLAYPTYFIYYVRVRAYNGYNYSDWSGTRSIQIVPVD